MLTLSLIAGVACPALAQPAFNPKISPQLERARRAPKARLRTLSKTVAVVPERDSVWVLVRVKPGTSLERLRAVDPGIRFGTLSGNIATAELPLNLVDKLAGSDSVERIGLSLKLKPLNDVARSANKSGSDFLGVLSTYGVTGLGNFYGSGVVVGIVDTGIDFRHQDFIAGTGGSAISRILFLWDQTDSGGPAPGGNFTYGSQYTQDQMTADIRNGTALVRELDTDGHGTHVAGSAAGDGSAPDGSGFSGLYKGMAPAADLVIVKTNFSNAGICDGVNYVFQKAAAAGKPAVVNLSLGGHLGAHDGGDGFETCITNLTGAGKVVVAAAGNEGADPIHASRTGSGDITMNRPNFGNEAIDMWHDGGDRFTIAVSATDQNCGTITVPAYTTPGSGTVIPTSPNFCNATVAVYNAVPTDSGSANGAKNIYIEISDTATDPVNWKFTFTQTASGGSGRIDAWVAANSRFTGVTLDTTSTVGLPATAPGIIAVGAYTSKTTFGGTLGDIAYFSSRGPNRIGTIKPDIAAPGMAIVSSLSAASGLGNISADGKHAALQGTSMATPITAGSVALLLQQRPSMTKADILTQLQAVARHDSKATLPAGNTWGYGKLMATPPAYPVPTGLAATALSPSSLRWTWNDISNEEGYRLRRTTDNAVLAALAAGTVQFDQSGLTPNTSQQVYVEAYNLAGSSTGAGVTRFTQAAVPPGLAVTGVSSFSASVSWSPNGNPPGTQFELSMSRDDFITDFSTPIAFSATSTGTTAMVSLLEDTTYTFRLRARNGDLLATDFSATVSTVTDVGLPRPVGVSGAALGVSSIAWSWGLSKGATAYNLNQASDNASLGNTTALRFTRTGLSTNTAYGLKVTATNPNGLGPQSSASTVYTLAAAPAAAALTGVGMSSITFSWSANENPAGTVFAAEGSANGFGSVAASSWTVVGAAVLAGLSPDTLYSLRVKAQNGDGIATEYATLAATPTLAAVPSGLSLTQLSSSSLRAAWSRNGNQSDTQFELSLSTDAFAASVSTPLAFSGASAVASTDLTGLATGATQYVRLRARNRAGIATAFVTDSLFLPENLVKAVEPGVASDISFGDAKLVVPPAAFSEPLNLTLHSPASFPAPASRAGNLAPTSAGIEILTDKALQPKKALDLTLSYSSLPPGVTRDQLVIARYEPALAVWVPLPSTPDTASNRVTARLDHLSLYQVMALKPAGALSSAVVTVYPNPVYTSRGQSMKFTGLPAGAEVKVYTFRGDLVRSVTASGGGMAVWDGRNGGGSAAASGVYLALIKSGGDTKVVKVMVER